MLHLLQFPGLLWGGSMTRSCLWNLRMLPAFHQRLESPVRLLLSSRLRCADMHCVGLCPHLPHWVPGWRLGWGLFHGDPHVLTFWNVSFNCVLAIHSLALLFSLRQPYSFLQFIYLSSLISHIFSFWEIQFYLTVHLSEFSYLLWYF